MSISGISSLSINVMSQPQQFDALMSSLNSNPFSNRVSDNDFAPRNDIASETEQLSNQLDHIFGYRKELSAAQKKQVNRLFDQIDNILQSNANTEPSKEQHSLLDKLFDEVDEIYQARSYESLTCQEQQMVDRLLDQLDMSLA